MTCLSMSACSLGYEPSSWLRILPLLVERLSRLSGRERLVCRLHHESMPTVCHCMSTSLISLLTQFLSPKSRCSSSLTKLHRIQPPPYRAPARLASDAHAGSPAAALMQITLRPAARLAAACRSLMPLVAPCNHGQAS
ncbi:hypothetical protein V8C26DRAFT_397148 [Trichoderma gracile]